MQKLIALAALALSSTLPAQQAPAVRPLGATVARSGAEFGPVVWARHLRNGSVLLNDPSNRRVVMLDSTLTTMTVVADSTAATANAYSGRSASLVPYRADSTLFVDPQSLTMLVIDPTGSVGRTMALPRSQDAMALGNTMFGGAAFDGQRLVYRGLPNFRMMGMRGAAGGAPGGAVPAPPEMPDSTPIVRVDLATRQVDTVGHIRIPKVKLDIQRDENNRVSISSVMNPLPTVDDWAVLADGSVAIVRGRDYHVDFIRPDGTTESAAKIPFEWRRLSDEDKVAFMDSVKAQRERMLAQMEADTGAHAQRAAMGSAAAGGGIPEVRIQIGGDRAPPRRGAGEAGARPAMPRQQMNFIPPDELPDYQPVFFAGAARADADGNLWVRTVPNKATAGGPIYDVINGKGQLVDRVQVPTDRAIIGFGPGGVVYLLSQSGATRVVERASVR